MGSPLAEMPRVMPFQTPPDYFRQTLREVKARIQAESDTTNATAEAELQSLSPLLAKADRKMPFRLSADAITVPSGLLSAIPEADPSGSAPPADAPRPLASVRKLTPLRAAAAILVLGATAWFLHTQIPSAEPPTMEATAMAQPAGMDSINDQALDGFMRDTEVVTAYETIGMEVSWTDAFKDITSGDRSVLDSELASLPEAILMAYVNETDIHPIQP
jgi:hypothetical protein